MWRDYVFVRTRSSVYCMFNLLLWGSWYLCKEARYSPYESGNDTTGKTASQPYAQCVRVYERPGHAHALLITLSLYYFLLILVSSYSSSLVSFLLSLSSSMLIFPFYNTHINASPNHTVSCPWQVILTKRSVARLRLYSETDPQYAPFFAGYEARYRVSSSTPQSSLTIDNQGSVLGCCGWGQRIPCSCVVNTREDSQCLILYIGSGRWYQCTAASLSPNVPKNITVGTTVRQHHSL